MRLAAMALALVACGSDVEPTDVVDGGAHDARAMEPTVIGWREVECAVLCAPERGLALCVGTADRGRCAYQCAHMTPAGDYCPLFTPQF
jgi:hypothetical protein